MVLWEKWPAGGCGGGSFSGLGELTGFEVTCFAPRALEGTAGLLGVMLRGVLVIGGAVEGGEGRDEDGVAKSSWYRLRPMAQMSSQLLCPTGSPCVRQSHAMSHAKKTMASTKFA